MASIVDYLIQHYFSQLYMSAKNKMFSKSLAIALTIANMENQTKRAKELAFIYENTTKMIEVPLVMLEDIYEKNLQSKVSKMKLYTIYDKQLHFFEIVKGLNDAYVRITQIVTEIAKELNVEMIFDFSKYPVGEGN